MPHRLEPILAAIVSMVAGAFSSCVAAFLALMPDAAPAAVTIMDDEKMRLICIIGAVGGGVLSALIFSPPQATGRMFAVKVGSSSLAGILFTPSLVHWLGWTLNIDTLLGTSAGIALVGIGVIRVAVPLWAKYAARKFGPPDDPKA